MVFMMVRLEQPAGCVVVSLIGAGAGFVTLGSSFQFTIYRTTPLSALRNAYTLAPFSCFPSLCYCPTAGRAPGAPDRAGDVGVHGQSHRQCGWVLNCSGSGAEFRADMYRFGGDAGDFTCTMTIASAAASDSCVHHLHLAFLCYFHVCSGSGHGDRFHAARN